MSQIDPATLLTLLTADPTQRQAAVHRMLLERIGGNTGTLDLTSALAGAAGGSPPQPENPTPALQGLYREASLLNAELRRISALLAEVGHALGACPRCLGADEACAVCAGEGAPGRDAPDPDRFEELIAPAVRRLAEETAFIDDTIEEQAR